MRHWMYCWIGVVFSVVFFKAPFALQAKEQAVVCRTTDTNNYECITYYENMPRFSAGNIREWIKNHLIYPIEAFEAGIEGKVYITLTIGADSLVHDIQVIRGADPLLDKAAVEVLQKMPHWLPATQRGVPVVFSFTLSVPFRCDEAVLMTADEMPVFPQPLVPWLREKAGAYYKPLTNESSIQGKSYVAFIIEKDGSLFSPEIVKSSGYPDMDEKALEIIRNMPRWTPGRHQGKPVRIRFTVPVVFAPF